MSTEIMLLMSLLFAVPTFFVVDTARIFNDSRRVLVLEKILFPFGQKCEMNFVDLASGNQIDGARRVSDCFKNVPQKTGVLYFGRGRITRGVYYRFVPDPEQSIRDEPQPPGLIDHKTRKRYLVFAGFRML